LTGCLYCIDNDILQKLATFDLFDETIALFGASASEINILTTAKYKFQQDWDNVKAGKHRAPEAQFVNYERTVELAKLLPQIVEAEINIDLFNQLSTFENIDQGEAILTAYVSRFLQKERIDKAFILTGDKRYLKALAQVTIPITESLFSHKFWCLEQLILWNIDAYGFESVRDKVVPVRDCDKALKVVFGSGELSTAANAIAALNSYIETLRKNTGDFLHSYPH
jgi:hypothetical protein